jgi:hypothetical protein
MEATVGGASAVIVHFLQNLIYELDVDGKSIENVESFLGQIGYTMQSTTADCSVFGSRVPSWRLFKSQRIFVFKKPASVIIRSKKINMKRIFRKALDTNFVKATS